MFIYECSSVAELLAQCQSLTVQPHSGRWFFRGQRDSRWSLLPSLLRPDMRTGLPVGDPMQYEKRIIQYMKVVLEAETSLPSRVIKDDDRVLALAQHYGCATRFLDWTREPKVALYFAASGALRADKNCRAFSVFAMADIYLNIRDGGATIVRPERGANPNLAAQRGLHTKASWEKPDLWDASRAKLTRKFVVSAALDTRLVRFDMPREQSEKAMQYLLDAGIDGASLFPGHPGIARLVDDLAELGEVAAAKVFDDRSYVISPK